MTDYQHALGYPVFSKFIEIEPATKGPLGIEQIDIEKESERYKYLAKTYFDMLDLALDMLGKIWFQLSSLFCFIKKSFRD